MRRKKGKGLKSESCVIADKLLGLSGLCFPPLGSVED